MNTKITLTTIDADISERNWQYLYLRLINHDGLADAVRAGTITVEQSERMLKDEMQWPVEHEEHTV